MAQSYTQVFIGDKKKIDPNLKIQRKHNIISEFENTKKTLYNNSSSPSIIIQKKNQYPSIIIQKKKSHSNYHILSDSPLRIPLR